MFTTGDRMCTRCNRLMRESKIRTTSHKSLQQEICLTFSTGAKIQGSIKYLTSNTGLPETFSFLKIPVYLQSLLMLHQ